MAQARRSDLAPVLMTTPDTLLTALEQRGYPAQSADRTLDTLATDSGNPPCDYFFCADIGALT